MYKFSSITELILTINNVLENTLENVSFIGEIAQVQFSQTGHIYFTVKDEESQISCAMWRSYANSIKFTPKQGDMVVCVGRCSLYGKSGRFQMVVSSMELQGEGDLKKKYEELKKKLEAQGLFDKSRKRPLPFFPKAIGVVTSFSGAVIHDIMFKVKERMPICQVYLIDVRVQGDGASKEIANAIRKFNELQNVDVLIVGRGGGSLEDLWCFNEEEVACAIYASKIPVISAVGHESDVSLADLVADYRAPTPTGAAEVALPDRKELLEKVKFFETRLKDFHRFLLVYRQNLSFIEERLYKSFKHNVLEFSFSLEKIKNKFHILDPKNQIKLKKEKLNVLKERLLKLNPKNKLDENKEKIKIIRNDFLRAINLLFDKKRQILESQKNLFKAFDYKKTLKRGYSIVKQKDKILVSKKGLKVGDNINIIFYDGDICSKVIK
ncbi:MAG: exodeoxyribonuclease VII large subunit [Bdellovibrionota bacterium]